MFQKHASKEQGEGASEEENTQTPLETIDITLKGGVEVKLYLNRLTARGKYRRQTGRYSDPTKASGSGANPEHRLCSPDGPSPLAALRAWILAYGSKLEEDSRKDKQGVDTSPPPKTPPEELL